MTLRLLFPPSLGPIIAKARGQLLAQWLTEQIGSEIDLAVATTYGELQQRILDAEVDLAWAPPGICARVESEVDAIYKAVREGHSSYRAAIIVRAGTVTEVEKLAGARAAWVDRLAVAGYLLGVARLRQAGMDSGWSLAEQRFVGSYGNALRAVAAHDADVTSIFTRAADEGAARERLRDLVGGLASQLAPIGYSDEVPTDGLVVTRRARETGQQDAVTAFTDLTGERGSHNFMLSILEAEALVFCPRGAYAALR